MGGATLSFEDSLSLVWAVSRDMGTKDGPGPQDPEQNDWVASRMAILRTRYCIQFSAMAISEAPDGQAVMTPVQQSWLFRKKNVLKVLIAAYCMIGGFTSP